MGSSSRTMEVGQRKVKVFLPSSFPTLAPDSWHLPRPSIGQSLLARSISWGLWKHYFLPWLLQAWGWELLLVLAPLQVPHCLLGGPFTPPTFLNYPKALHWNHLIRFLFAAKTLMATGRNCVIKAPGMETRTKKSLNKYLLNECASGMPASLAGSSRKMQAGCPIPCIP